MRVLVFGDSITQGFFDGIYGGWCSRLAQYTIKETLDSEYEKSIDVFNLGISGDCTNRLLARFDAEAAVRTKKEEAEYAIVFAIGVNDTQRYVATGKIKTPREDFKKNLKSLCDKAYAYTQKVVFVGLLPIDEDMVNPMPWADDRGHACADVEEYNALIQTVCSEKDCLFIPMQDIFEGEDLNNVLTDGIHPNAEGHRLMFERIKDTLEKEEII